MNVQNTPDNKKRFKFGPIDIVIIILFIACVVGIILRYNISEKLQNTTDLREAEVSFLVSDISPSAADAFIIGDVAFWEGNRLGPIKSKDVYNAVEYNANADGFPVKSENLEKRDVRGVITASGKLTDDGFLLNGNMYIAAGKELKINTKNIAVTITVTGVNVLN